MAYGILKINNCLYRPPIKKGNKLVINLLPFSICPHDICTFLRFIRKRVRDAAFFLIIMLVTFAATL